MHRCERQGVSNGARPGGHWPIGSRLGAALVVVAVFVAAFMPVAFAQSAYVSVSPNSSIIGGTFVVTGEGFTPLSTVTVTFDGVTLGTDAANELGEVAAAFVVPDGTGAGRHTVRVTDTAGITASREMTVNNGDGEDDESTTTTEPPDDPDPDPDPTTTTVAPPPDPDPDPDPTTTTVAPPPDPDPDPDPTTTTVAPPPDPDPDPTTTTVAPLPDPDPSPTTTAPSRDPVAPGVDPGAGSGEDPGSGLGDAEASTDTAESGDAGTAGDDGEGSTAASEPAADQSGDDDASQIEVAAANDARPEVEEVTVGQAEIETSEASSEVEVSAVGADGVRVVGFSAGRGKANALIVFVTVTFADEARSGASVHFRMNGEQVGGSIPVAPGETRTYQLSGASSDEVTLSLATDDGSVLAETIVPPTTRASSVLGANDIPAWVLVTILVVVVGLVLLGLRSIYGTPAAVTSRVLLGGSKRGDEDDRELELIG